MHAMVLKQVGSPLEWTELPDRQPGLGEIRVKVAACGVCRTDLQHPPRGAVHGCAIAQTWRRAASTMSVEA